MIGLARTTRSQSSAGIPIAHALRQFISHQARLGDQEMIKNALSSTGSLLDFDWKSMGHVIEANARNAINR
jgi:hypothetical protein